MRNGLYIVFEGVVGTGKTTQSKLLVEDLKQKYPNREIIWTREPGGSPIAEATRVIVQGTTFPEPMEPMCEAYLYAAARAQSLRAVVKPVLDRGGIVVSDRSFCTSVAFQGGGRAFKGGGIKIEVENVLRINESAIEGFIPDLIIEIDLDPAIGLQRTYDGSGDKFESMPAEFFHRCIQGYRELSQDPRFSPIWKRVSGEGGVTDVRQRIQEVIVDLISHQ
ncbi:MAG: dTMP kinase [Patescibacteria group bacterium]